MIFLTIICVLLVGALLYEKRQNGVRDKEWALERAGLLGRIQHPQVIQPNGLPSPEAVSEVIEEIDEIDRVGEVFGGTDAD